MGYTREHGSNLSEGSLLKGSKCVTGCTTRRCSCKRNNTQCSEGCQCTNCLNMPRTGGREDIDLAEIALEEEVTADITQLDADTDELLDWAFGAENEDNVSMSDTTCVKDTKCVKVWRMMLVNMEIAYMICKTL